MSFNGPLETFNDPYLRLVSSSVVNEFNELVLVVLANGLLVRLTVVSGTIGGSSICAVTLRRV